MLSNLLNDYVLYINRNLKQRNFMKQKLNKIYRIFIICILILFSSCEKEPDDFPLQDGIRMSKVSLKDPNIMANHSLMQEVQKTKSKGRKGNTANKIVYDSIYDFYFDDENGVYLEKGEQKSFTFPVYRENNDGKIENITFNLNEKGEYESYLVKYDFTEEQLQSFTQEQLEQYQTVFTNLTTNKQMFECADLYVWQDIGHVHSGTEPGTEGWVWAGEICSSGGGGSGGSPGNETGGSGGTGTGTTTDTSTSIITTPVGGGGGNSTVSANARKMNTFINNLDWSKRQVFDGFPTTSKDAIFNYFIANNFANGTPANVTSFLQSIITNNTKDYFPNELNLTEMTPEREESINTLIDYVVQNNFSPESKEFVNGLMTLANSETNQTDASNLVIISLLSTKPLDANFLSAIDPYIDLDLSNQEYHDPIIVGMTVKYHVLKSLHPGWSKSKLFWEISKEYLHMGLDMFGLVPGPGEIADLVNGVIYTLEGDHLNAGLSYSSTIPIYGWVSMGTKYGLKVVSSVTTVYTISTKVKLVWKVVGNTVSFGSQGQLRKVLGMAAYNIDPRQAHHLIPWASRVHDVVQKAAKHGFHMNEVLNGIAVAASRNQPNHNAYNNLIQIKLDNFASAYPNATPQQCYDFLTDLIQDIRDWVISHPNSHLNDLVLP